MDHKKLAQDALSKCDYNKYKDHLYKQYLETKDDTDYTEYQKALKTVQIYNEAVEFLKIDPNDYYKILGVDKNTDEETIKKSHKKILFKFHPDKTKIDICNNVISRAMNAYKVLSDKEKRKDYDFQQSFFNNRQSRTGNFYRSRTNMASDVDTSDILEDVLRTFFGARTHRTFHTGYHYEASNNPFSQGYRHNRRSNNWNRYNNRFRDQGADLEISGKVVFYSLIFLVIIISILC